MNQENYEFLIRCGFEEIPGPITKFVDEERYFIVRDMFGAIDQVIGTDLVDRGKEFLKKCPVYVVENPFRTPDEIDQGTEISRDMMLRKLKSMG
jgi:hypothetical protein